ncbi:MAG: hypothetical protein ACP5NV_06400 [Candidatus Woesearchaeota archaeon]
MHRRKNYNCTVCSTSWECYVYDEFATPFSVCLYCMMDIENIFRRYPKVNETCNLCDTSKECSKIPLSNNAVTNEIFICTECFAKIKEIMRTTKK